MKGRVQTPMVTVVVVTYNQEQWIRQTLDSILAQQTEYPFEVIIGEDHGTDGTRAICQEYADKYQNVKLTPSIENVGVCTNWIRCVQAGTGKYIMNCAGDDYWHNPRMIQIMVEYMETHPECVLCHSDYNELKQRTGEIVEAYNQSNGINPPQGKIQMDILSGKSKIAAVTQCIRRDVLNEHIPFDKFVELNFPREDWPMQLIISAYGEIHYIPVSTATYRVGQESITRTSNYEKIIVRAKKDKEMTEYLYTLFPEWGLFKDGPFFDKIGYHQAMMAAYRNNDYKAAHYYAKMDVYPNKATYAASTWLTFILFRWIQKVKRKL